MKQNFVTPRGIKPVSEGMLRPLWSVMIPTFNCAKYLRQTLESVLAQDPGPNQMQIEVVDDCSAKDDPEPVVNEVGKGRVAFHRKPKNEGAIPNFNTCIERSRGHLVHILHGDDFVLPDFYDVVAKAANQAPEVAIVIARCFTNDLHGEIEGLSERITWLEKPASLAGELYYKNWIRTPGVVMRRAFYESNGDFDPSLVHTADWEMWIRAISLGKAVFVNRPLACYREFPVNDTGRLMRTGENLLDYERLAKILAFKYHDFDARKFKDTIDYMAQWQMEKYRANGDLEALDRNKIVWAGMTPIRARYRYFVRQWWRRLAR